MNPGKRAISRFEEKVVLITGSSKGIGRATALQFCKLGAKVVMNGRNAEQLENSVNELKELGFNVFGVPCDVTDSEQCKILIRKSIEEYGSIDVLINNAGISMRGKLDELEPSVFEKVFFTNVLGSVYPVIHSLPHIKKSQGSIVFISSVAAIRGLPGLSAYCSSKMALRALSESMRFELKRFNIHIGLLYVGYAQNDTGKKYMASDGSFRDIKPRKNVRIMSQEDVAKAIVRNVYKRHYITVLSSLGKLNSVMQRFFPSVVEWVIARSQKRVERMSK